MKFAAVLLLVGIVCAMADINSQFVEFQSRYNKIYSNPGEYNHRLQVFATNVKKAQLLAAANPQTQFGVTKFMDMTPGEFKSTVLMSNPPPLNKNGPVWKSKVNATAPTAFDWRNQGNVVTPVYNQGQCGSCWAFSATENIESTWALAGNALTQLSMQQIVDCDTNDGGCGGGWPYSAYAYVISAGGLDSLSSYPYTAQNGQCAFSSANIAGSISNWQYVTQSNDETAMVNYLSATSPLSICVDASQWQYYTGGVLMASSCTTNLDHCVEAIGYDLGAATPYWAVRNSWGTDWGINGYIQLQYGQNTCGLASVVTATQAS
jgi:C1A family cysteine protease